jgi:predicted ribosomally synthesized peptide with SipW-like signal peptide
MRNIILSLLMVIVLVAGGVGGTLANMSDTESAVQNSFATGSLDLMILDSEEGIWNNDPPYGSGVQHEVEISCAYPDTVYYDWIDVANYGDCVSGDLYFKIKNLWCDNVTPTHEESRIWDHDPGEVAPGAVWELKPEPEMVEEEGGVLDQHNIPAALVDDLGDDCCMIGHTMIAIFFDDTLVLDWTYFGDLDGDSDGDTNAFAGMDWTALGHLPSCGEVHRVWVYIKFPQLYDDLWTKWANADGYYGDPLFQDHPTNAYMLDRIWFDIEFGLVDDGGGG